MVVGEIAWHRRWLGRCSDPFWLFCGSFCPDIGPLMTVFATGIITGPGKPDLDGPLKYHQ